MKTLSKLSAVMLILFANCAPVLTAGDPIFRRQAVVLGGNYCVTPFQSYSSPVYNYSTPVITKSVPVVQSSSYSSSSSYSKSSGGYDDISTALKIITDFKLKQQTLEQGLQSLGYSGPQAQQSTSTYQQSYAPQQAQGAYPAVNFGLAPYEQGNTQYQVESFEYSSFGSNMDDIKEQLNSLLRLSENMQKNSVSVGASVGTTVQGLADSAAAQAEGHVEVARIQAEAVARVAMIQAAAEMMKQSRVNSKVDLRIGREPQGGEIIPPPAFGQLNVPPPPTPIAPENREETLESYRQLLTESCAQCHTGENIKGNFNLESGNLTQAEVDHAVMTVFEGSMPKNNPLQIPDRLRVAEALQSLVTE